MDPDLLTQLVRAGNDGVIPAPLAGEDMNVYKFRAACAGAIVAAKWLEQQMAEKAEQAAMDAEREAEKVLAEKAEKERVREEMSGAAMGGGRPDDVPVSSSVTSPDGSALHPTRTPEDIDRILRQPSLNGSGARGQYDEIGVD